MNSPLLWIKDRVDARVSSHQLDPAHNPVVGQTLNQVRIAAPAWMVEVIWNHHNPMRINRIDGYMHVSGRVQVFRLRPWAQNPVDPLTAHPTMHPGDPMQPAGSAMYGGLALLDEGRAP